MRNLEEPTPTIALKQRQCRPNRGDADIDSVMLYGDMDTAERGRSCSQVYAYDSTDEHAFQQCLAQGINGEMDSGSDAGGVAHDTLQISDDLINLFYVIEQGSLMSH